MTSSTRRLRTAGNIGLTVGGLVVGWLILEVGLGVWEDAVERAQLAALKIQADHPTVDAAVDAPWNPDGSSALHVRAADPDAVYELRPDARATMLGHEIRTNALGMRDDETTASPAPGTLRLLAVGDSVTFGAGVDAASTWPQALEARLRTARPGGCDVEVLNAGVGGYDAVQVAAALRRRVRELHPDLALYAAVSNDGQLGADVGLWRHFNRSRSRVVDFVSLRWLRWRAGSGGPDLLDRGLSAMASTAADTHTPLVVVSIPSPDEAGWASTITTRAARAGLSVLTLDDAFAVAPTEVLFSDRLHPTADGHALVAAALEGSLQARLVALCTGARAPVGPAQMPPTP